jgi:hypothetical protein
VLTQKAGWTAGAGIEGRLFGNVTGKIEYLYMDFGTISTSVTNPFNATPVTTLQQFPHHRQHRARRSSTTSSTPRMVSMMYWPHRRLASVYRPALSRLRSRTERRSKPPGPGPAPTSAERRLRYWQVEHRYRDSDSTLGPPWLRPAHLPNSRDDVLVPRPASIGSPALGSRASKRTSKAHGSRTNDDHSIAPARPATSALGALLGFDAPVSSANGTEAGSGLGHARTPRVTPTRALWSMRRRSRGWQDQDLRLRQWLESPVSPTASRRRRHRCRRRW